MKTWRATCGVDGSAWKVEGDANPAPNGSFCPDCRERGSMAPGVLNWKADDPAADRDQQINLLAQELDVSPARVRQAIENLKARGLISETAGDV